MSLFTQIRFPSDGDNQMIFLGGGEEGGGGLKFLMFSSKFLGLEILTRIFWVESF